MSTSGAPREAVPRTAAEWAALPSQPDVVSAAARRDVSEIVHFTTLPKGALGILASECIKNRRELREDEYLEHIITLNANNRSRDAAWHDYVNLSISRINSWFFPTAQRWHRDEGISWAIFSFSVDILGHPGVVFTTTNNAYDPYCRRAEGEDGFERLFEPEVIGYGGRTMSRRGVPDNCPTDHNAEVLYPGALSLDHLKRIRVLREEDLDGLEGTLAAVDMSDLPIIRSCSPEAFR